jgi:alpha-beta hydrolase superfamily lysophospholipase
VTTTERAPGLELDAPTGGVKAVALVLPGGRVDSLDPTDPRQLAAVRMRPFASALRRHGAAHGLGVGVVRYRYRGWNGDDMSPVADTRWALDEVRRRHGDVDVVLVGHSMGGRTALRVADDASVRGVAALAPWLPREEPVAQLVNRDLLVVHGDLDRITSPRASRRYAERANSVARSVEYVTIHGDTHAMLFRFAAWHRLVTRFTLETLALG